MSGGSVGGFVVLRLRAHWLLVSAALLTVLLTTSVLAALAGFTGSVGDAGVRRALRSTSAADTTLLISGDLPYPARAHADATVRGYARQAFPGLPVAVRSSAVSDAYGLPAVPGAAPGADPDLTTLADLDHSRLVLLKGSWPTAPVPGQPVPVALPAAAQTRLPAVGGLLALKDRFTGHTLTVRLVGVYRARSTADPYWQLDPLGGKGSSQVGFTSYGPLLADPAVFSAGAVAEKTVYWQTVADFSTVTASRADALAGTVSATLAAASRDSSLGEQANATSGLPQLVPALDRALVVARSSLLVGALQLVLLALFAILLAARLIADAHESEDALLNARGATGRRLTTLACAEGALLVLPSLVAAPLLAGPLVRLLSRQGPMASAGVRLGALPVLPTVLTAAVAALGCLAALLTPYFRRRRTPVAGNSARTRRRVPPGLLKAGGDVVLLVLAAVAYWQLRHYSATGSGLLATGSGGTLGIDPVLVTAPALTLCAGAVLAMRLLPVVAGIGDRFASRSSGLPGALAGWQLARRPQQGAAPTVMLLVLAVAMGTLAVGQDSTIQRSQTDQAAFETGADLRVTGSSGQAFGQNAGLAGVPGVGTAVGVARGSLALPQGRTGELLALDTRAERTLLPLRSDLSSAPVGKLLAPLAVPSPPSGDPGAGLTVPGRPHELDLDVGATAAGGSFPGEDTLFVTVTDRHGLPYQLRPLTVPVDGRTHTLRIDLDDAADAPLGAPSYPLTISGFGVSFPVPQLPSSVPAPRQAFVVHAVRADGAEVGVPAGMQWQAQPASGAQSASGAQHDAGATLLGVSAAASAPVTLGFSSVDTNTQDIQQEDELLLTPVQSRSAGPVPAVVTDGFLTATGARVGQTVTFGQDAPVLKITAAVRELPTTGPGGSAPGATDSPASSPDYGGAMLVDLAAYDAWLVADGQPAQQPTEWWIGVAPHAPGGSAAVAAALRARPDVQSVLVQDEVLGGLRGNPLAAGTRAALLCSAVIAALLAAVGFGVGAAGSVRRRANEAGVLRALGAGRRDLARSTAVELGVPLLLGVLMGLLMGALLTRMLIPLIVLTTAATRPDPPVLVQLPLGQVALFVAATAAVPLLVTLLAGRGGGDSAQRLRTLEDL
ncbi:FtsX-like permease family protein [Streptacidiphilus cavernicola]|uniref:FtsX-like permease family protein n=1 Tax=Streptacidiphilus cavernicola TaxID=3342716 RepID=A0ABV6VSK5_9ACTN